MYDFEPAEAPKIEVSSKPLKANNADDDLPDESISVMKELEEFVKPKKKGKQATDIYAMCDDFLKELEEHDA